MDNMQDPYLTRQLSVFCPRGVHERVNLFACSLSLMLMQERHRDLSWFRQEKALRPVGGGDLLLSCT